MANPAINAALLAAAQAQELTVKALTDQLEKGRALNPRSAIPLDLSAKGSDKMLRYLIERGQVKDVGGRYWLDKAAVAEATATATRWVLITLAFLASVAASLIAILATR